MNREALPLIVGIVIPFIVVGLIASYVLGLDYIYVLARIPIIYYIVLTPFILGAMAAAFWLRKNEE